MMKVWKDGWQNKYRVYQKDTLKSVAGFETFFYEIQIYCQMLINVSDVNLAYEDQGYTFLIHCGISMLVTKY